MTRRHLSIFALAASALPLNLMAQTSLSIGNAPGYPGGTVSVPVSLRQSADKAVAAQFDVAFNAGKVGAADSLGTVRLANHTVKSREIAPGVRRTLVYSLNNTNVPGTNGPIVQIPFAVSSQETIGSGPLTLANVILARTDGTAQTPVGLNAGAIFVRPVNLLPDGHVQLFLQSTQDQRYAIQATTNLVNWVNISTNTATGDFMDLLDVDAAGVPYRFYRWQLLP
jgi:hypothetical protein